MRKLFALVLALILVLCLSACGKKDTVSDDSSQTSGVASATESDTVSDNNDNDITPEPDNGKNELVGDIGTPDNTVSHTHKFADATCTVPKKCGCGTTEGVALGHSYKDGVCARCGGEDPDYKADFEITIGAWEANIVQGNLLFQYTFVFAGNQPYWSMSKAAEPTGEEDLSDPELVYEYGGKKYVYLPVGDGDDISFTESVRTVTVTDTQGKKLVLERIDDTVLKVTSVDSGFISNECPIKNGTKFEFLEDLM